MIALDTSTLVAFLRGEKDVDTDLADQILKDKTAVLPPVVVTEMLSAPDLDPQIADILLCLPVLVVEAGYWERTGRLRASLLAAGKKARLADCLIAQSCLDHDLAIVARDRDFRHMAEAGLLVLPAAGSASAP